MGAAALPLAAICGFLLGFSRFGFAPHDGLVYLYGLPALVLLILFSQHGAGVGAAGWLGFTAGDVIHGLTWANHSPKMLMVLAGCALSAAVLWVLLVAIPVSGRSLGRSLTTRRDGTRLKLMHQVLIHGLLQLLFVFLWFQVAPLLLQAVGLWQAFSVDTDNLTARSRDLGWAPAMAAAYAAGIRTVFEANALAGPTVREKRARRLTALAGAASGGAGDFVSALLKAAGLTFLLSSLLTGWMQAAILLMLMAAAMVLREVVLPSLGLGAALRRISLAVRLPLAAVAVYAVGFAVMKFLPPATGFMPSLYVIVASIVLCAILLPPAPPPAKAKPSPARRGPA